MNRMRRRIGIVLGLGMTAGLVACPPPFKLSLVPRPECPHSWEHYFDSATYRQEGVKFTPISQSQFSLPGGITNVPEFHDCQRLLIEKDHVLSYGGLAAIFARMDLGPIFQRYKTGKPTTVPSAVRRPDTPPPAGGGRGARTADTSFLATGLPVAEIFSEGQAAKLGIGVGFNCLLLRQGAGGWQALMVFVGQTEQTCIGLTADPTYTFTALTVQPGNAVTDPTDIPPVARWEWDHDTPQQIIGIMCDDRWCDVGPLGFHPPSPHGVASDKREKRVKGWYDEQLLAYFDPSGVLTTSTNKGTVFPDPFWATNMARLNDPDAQWIPAAHVTMTEHSTAYRNKYGFEQALADAPFNTQVRVDLCQGNSTKCAVPSGTSTVDVANCTTGYWARSQFGSEAPKYFCVAFRSYPGIIPMTVRWRWRPKDETIWVACPTGCCEVDSYDK